jgi:cob(I)alamin adenosyltransferase
VSKGQIHIYTGNGKGKTTAALGLSLRAVCSGKKVYFGQFVKGMEYSELKAPEYLPGFEIRQFGRDCFIFNDPTDEDRAAARKGLEICRQVIEEGRHDIVVLDELNIALHYKLFSVEEAIELVKSKKDHQELIITGRYAPQELLDLADLVTEMKEIKHYYKKDLEARKGIEF